MCKRITKVGRIICLIAMILSSQVWAGSPVFATAGVFENIAGVYTIRGNFSAYYLDNTRAARATAGTLTISDNTLTTLGSISTASLTITGVGTIAMAGFVGTGTTPRISLIGSDGSNVVNINGRVRVSDASIRITGRGDGWSYHSGGTLGDDPAGAAATWSTVAPHGGSIVPLLTQSAAAGSTYVQYTPTTTPTLEEVIANVNAIDWGLWYKLQDSTSGGPQLELRFTAPTNVNPDGAGHVDVTLLTPTTGTGAWVNRTYTSAFAAMYYGNDPYDGTAYSDDAPETLATVLASIDAEGAMTANGGFSAADWTLSRVRVEIWDGGARTCYVDDVTIDGVTQSFEPVQYSGTFTATYTIP